jgi:NodT family efflux transporter outer membrane factor (OMF) lipoprotein
MGLLRFSIACVACVATLLPGCAALGPDYRAPEAGELGVPASWHGVAPGHVSAPADLAAWWRTLGDATLDDLIAAVLAANPDVKVAQARLREARARRDIASATRFPTVGASASASRTRTEAGAGSSRSAYDAGLDASWEPDIFGGQRRAIEAAGADLEAAVEDMRATQVSLAAEVALNYVQVRALQARLAIARANLGTQSQTLQLTQWRAQAGLTSSLDVEQARAAVEQTRAQIPSLDGSLVAARNRLAILAGAPPGALDARLAATAAIPAVPTSIAIGIPTDTLRQRPDLRAAERRLAAETARIGQQEAQRFPSLPIGGSIGVESLTLGGLLEREAIVGRLVARLAATLFDGGRLRSQVEAQSAVRERALRNYEAAVLTALEDVENALAQLANARVRREALANAADAARNAAIYAEHRYSAGITDFQTVLDTQRTLLSAQDNLKSTEAEQASALIRLYKALGGGWDPAGAAP